jgi:hypothetical protein
VPVMHVLESEVVKHPEPTHSFVPSQASVGSSSTSRVLKLETGLLALVTTLRSLTKGL